MASSRHCGWRTAKYSRSRADGFAAFAGRECPASARRAVAEGKEALKAAGFKVEYLEVRDAETLRTAAPGSRRPLRVLVAAWLGKTRLIDNEQVPGFRD